MRSRIAGVGACRRRRRPDQRNIGADMSERERSGDSGGTCAHNGDVGLGDVGLGDVDTLVHYGVGVLEGVST